MKIDNKNYYELVMACLFCRKVEEKKRLIQSCSNRHIVPVLMGLLNDALQTNADSKVLPAGAWLCYQCLVSHLVPLAVDSSIIACLRTTTAI